MRTRMLMLAMTAVAHAGCDSAEPLHEVHAGLYQLTTASISGNCKLDYSVRPGPVMVGNVMPVDVVASSVAVDVRVCGHANQDPSCAGLGDSYHLGMARDGNQLNGSLVWAVPGCGMPDYTATLTVAGAVTANDTLSLTWTATIAAAATWTCSGYAPCTATIEQRMAPPN